MESPSDKGFILDAKYKRLQNGVAREDLYQIVTYMHTMRIDNGGFLYPIPSEKEGLFEKKCKLSGLGGTISTMGFPIPRKTDIESFRAQMTLAEKQLALLVN